MTKIMSNSGHQKDGAMRFLSLKRLMATAAASVVLMGTASAEVSTPQQVADRTAAHCQAPRWSPDGKLLAYDVYEPKRDLREIWISPIRGGDSVKVGPKGGRASAAMGMKVPPIVDFAWAPDMKLLNKPYVYSSIGLKKNFDLFADGSWLTKNPGNDGQPDWSPDGRYIAFTSQQRASGDIMLLDLGGDSDKPSKVTSWKNSTEFGPRWSPKTNHLLFTRARSGNKGQDIVVVTDVTQPKGNTKAVTDWNGDEIRPSWSPDGQFIAFYSNKGRKNDKIFDLWVIGADGTGALRLDKDVVVDDHKGPAWTPDSSTLLFVSRDFKADNPVRWVRRDGSQKGGLDTGTQLNSDLTLSNRGSTLRLAFRALGQRGSSNKTWQRIFVVTFLMDDLKAEN